MTVEATMTLTDLLCYLRQRSIDAAVRHDHADLAELQNTLVVLQEAAWQVRDDRHAALDRGYDRRRAGCARRRRVERQPSHRRSDPRHRDRPLMEVAGSANLRPCGHVGRLIASNRAR